MASQNTENLTPFGQLAVKLDGDFAALERLSGQIQRLEIESDSGLERAMKLLVQFTEHGQNITEGIQGFAKTLQAARESSEKAANVVAERAQQIQHRKQMQDQMQEKIGELGKKVKEVSDAMATLHKDKDKEAMPDQLKALDLHLGAFIDEAMAIKEEAQRTNLKAIERNAQSLCGTLQSARRKLGSAIAIVH